MNDLSKLEKAVQGLKTIKLRSYLGKTQGKLTARPVKSRQTGRLKGVALLNDEEIRKSIHVVTAETERNIEDGFEINLDDPIDKIDWEWIKHCPEIVANIDEADSSMIALFYVENLEQDTKDNIKRRQVKREAFEYLKDCSQSKKVEIARLIGTDAGTFTALELEDFLGDIADTNPKRIVDAFEDKEGKIKLFLFGLVDKRIVLVDQDGIYRWGNHILGTTEKSALEWLQIRDNAMYVKRLNEELYPSVMGNSGFELLTPLKEEDLVSTIEREKESDKKQSGKDEDEKEELLIPPVSEIKTLEEAKEKYKELFGKPAHHMLKLETILANIQEKEIELAADIEL